MNEQDWEALDAVMVGLALGFIIGVFGALLLIALAVVGVNWWGWA